MRRTLKVRVCSEMRGRRLRGREGGRETHTHTHTHTTKEVASR